MTHRRVPKEVFFASLDSAADREKEAMARNAQLSTTLSGLKDECKKEIRATLDEAQLEPYDRVHSNVKQRLADLAAATQSTTDSLLAASTSRRELLAEAARAISDLGVDAGKIAAIQKRYKAEARSAFEKANFAQDVAPYAEMDAAKAPSQATNPWAWRFPSYAGQSGWSYEESMFQDWPKEVQIASHYENALTGELYCYEDVRITGADDCDYGLTWANSALDFWYQMPATGMVEVWLYLQAIDARWFSCLEDEWGISDADVVLLSRPFLDVWSGNEQARYGTLLDLRQGEDEWCWGAEHSPGEYRYIHLYSFASHSAGEWLRCSVGLADSIYAFMNDESCKLHITSRWFLRAVAVRSTGNP